MEEVDEFGIPIKKQATTEVAVDEFGIPVKKKELTTTTSQRSTEPVQQPVSQPIQPSKQNGTVNEPIDLPQSYQSDRSNYKELVGGKKYNLLRGGKPITGTWDETTQTFIKDPLLNITPQQKKEVGFLQAVEAGVNLETPVETQEEMFGRVGVDIDNLKTDARQKISNIEYIASYPSVQRLAELDKLKQSTNDATVVADIDKQIADLRSKKMNDKEFTGIRFDNSEGKVYQNTLPTKPFEEFKGDVKKLPKTDLTVGQAYDEIKDYSDYVQQVQSEISGYNNMVNQYMISKLPEETKAKLEAIKGTPEYDAELERELVQSKNIENVIPALTYGLDKKLDALMEVGSNLGLDDDKLIQKKLGDIREKELFGKTMASTRAELASSIGGMLPDLAAGAVWSPLMLASMASTMPNDFLEQSIAEQSQSGEPIDVAKAKKFALTSTAAQTGMLVGAGKLGSHGLNLVSKTALKRAGELIYEMAKRGTKDAIVFGGLGTVMQNKINKAYDLSENDEYLKSALHMAVIGGMFALKEGLGKVGGVTKKASNEVDYLASYLPEEYTKKQVEQLVALGKTTAADGEETLDKLNTYRTIRNQLPVDLSMGQMEKIYPLWQQKREIHNMVEGASSEFKSVLNGQVEDIDRKILIEAAIPLTSAERMEKSKLTTGEAEGKQIDKARLRYLEKRDEAAKEAKKEVKEAAQAEEVKPVEPAKPKEEKPVVPVVEKPKPVKAGQLNQADVVAEKAPVSDLEVKKADIERRRQEELKGEEYRTTTISELWKDDEGNFYKTQKLANGQVKVDLVDENGRTLSTLGSFDGSLSIETIVNGGTKDTYGANNLTLTKVKDLEFTNKIVDKINAKYDAELAALEKPVEEVKPTETEPKPFTRERQPQEVGETETIVSKPASGQVAETVGDAHLKVSADVKTALDNSRKKQVVSVDKDGNQIVDEVDFTKDDADVELDRLEALAARGKLTEQEFLSSFFGQATDTATFAEVKQALKSDAVGFIKKLRQSFEGGKVEQRPTTERGAEKSGSENNSGQEEKQAEEVAPVTEAPTAEADGGVKKTAPAKMKQSDMAAEGGEIKVGDYSVKAEAVEMPDGESGMNVTITKPNGEVVELGKVYSEDVASEVNKKLRGFALSETAQTPKEQTEQTPLKKAAEEITFEQAGSDRTGKIVSVDEKGNYKVKGNDGANYTVSPDKARTPEVVAEAKKSVADNLKKLQELSKPKTVATIMDGLNPKQAAIVPSEIVTVPMRLLGLGDKYIAAATKKIEDGVGRAFRAAMGNSNKALSRSASEAQGLFKMLALTSEDITKRRLGLGAMAAAPLKAVNFYKNAVDIVGKTPTSLRNVHQVLDPEVYAARGETPMDEAALSPAEKNLYDLLKSMNNMVHDWHYANGRITEETYLKNKDKYAPRFYEENEFEGYPDDLKASFEEYAKQQNFSYIKERKNFADVMADNTIIEDPVYGTAMRLAQMMRNEAVIDYAKDVNSRVKTYKEGDADIPNSYVQLKGGGQFGNINTYGELTNKYVPRDVAEDFKGYFFINEVTQGAYDVLKKYNRFAPIQWIKKSKTLYNPITQLGNIGSNYIFAMMNGIDPLTFQNRKFEAAKEVKNKGALYLKLVEEGLLATDITTKDLKESAKPAPPKQGLRKALSDIDDEISEFYGSRDEIAKVAAYLAHTKDYGRTEKEAIDRVYSGFQNYNNVGRFYDLGSKLPIIGNPYIKFKGDLVRIMKNNYSQRPLTNIALLAGLNAMAGAFSKWSNEDEDVREARERRKFIPKIRMPKAVGGDIPLVWQTKYGEINAARYFAPGSIYDMGEKTTPAEQISDYLPIQLTQTESGVPLPVKIQDPFLGPFIQLAFNKDFRGAPIWDPEKTKWKDGNADSYERAQNAITFIARQDIPFFDKANDAYRAYNGESDYYGRNKSLKQALLNNVLKVEQFEKPEAIADLTKEIDRKFRKMDDLDKAINGTKTLAEKNIEKINLSKATAEQKKVLIAKEYQRAQNKAAELLNKQAEIKVELISPSELLKKLGAPIPTGEDNSQRPKRPERPERPKR